MASSHAGAASTDDKATMGTNADNGPSTSIGWMSMKIMGSKTRVRGTTEKDELPGAASSAAGDAVALTEVTSNDGLLGEEEDAAAAAAGRGVEGGAAAANGVIAHGGATYKVYRRRWFGLFQLALLNIIVSWDVSSCASLHPISSPPALRVLCG